MFQFCSPKGQGDVWVILLCEKDWKGMNTYSILLYLIISYYILLYLIISYYILLYLIHVCIILCTCWFNVYVYFIGVGHVQRHHPYSKRFQAAPGGHHGFIRIHEVGEGGQCGQCGQVVLVRFGAESSTQLPFCKFLV